MPKWLVFVNLLIIVLSVLAIIACAFYFSTPRVFKNVKVGTLNLSGKTLPEAESALENFELKRIYLNLPSVSYSVSYYDLGVKIDKEGVKDYVARCFFNFCDRSRPQKDLGTKILSLDKNKLKSFLDGVNLELKPLLFGPDISFEENYFKANDPQAKIEIDASHLEKQIVSGKVFSDEDVTVRTKVTIAGWEEQTKLTQELLAKVVEEPLVIKYGRQKVNIPEETLKTFLDESYRSEMKVSVNLKNIEDYLSSLPKKYPQLEVKQDVSSGISALKNNLLFRAAGEDPATVVILPLYGVAKTDGKVADKYLEVNKSQQRMYRFEGGKVIKAYVIATGLTWETPIGNFKVLSKKKMAISYTGNWSMPNYLPLGFIKPGYYFGLHEIPYHMNAAGEISSRDPNTMGSPATGGCIQLTKKDSLEIFNWADIGTPVVIVE